MKYKLSIIVALLCALTVMSGYAQDKPYRVGTTAANFLEVGVGGAAAAMGEAYVAVAEDMSSVYWNAAGLAYAGQNEVQFSYQPWFADINVAFAGAGIAIPNVGNLGISITSMNFGRTDVTTLDMQEGTGETFNALDYAVSATYARKLAQWFAFGATVKYVASDIWHMKASAAAMDLGVQVRTHFFSFSDDRKDGMVIGMSISNYGSRLKYSGMDLLRSIDILPDQQGNYKDVRGEFSMQQWELPLIFRIGVAVKPIVTNKQKLILALDALHPNNNSESINLGAQYQVVIPGRGHLFLRGGYHGLFMDENQFGPTMGCGVHFTLMHNRMLKVDYAYRDLGLLGNFSAFTLGLTY